MASVVQLGTQTALNANPSPVSLNGVVAGNQVVLCCAFTGTSVTISTITDTFGSSWVRKLLYISAGGVLECWVGTMAASGNLSATVNFSGVPSGGCSVTEVSFAVGLVDGPSATAAAGAAADPFLCAPLTTTWKGILFSWTRTTTNFGVVAPLDSFAEAVTGAQLGRTFALYRITDDGVSAAPGADMTSTESADSVTLVFYDGDPVVLVDNSDPTAVNPSCTVNAGGNPSAGGCVVAYPTIGQQQDCVGGGLVPTAPDLVQSEVWWGRA